MAPNTDYIYCTICGMPIESEAIALAGPHWPQYDANPDDLQVTDQEIVRYTAEVDSYPGKLFLLPEGQQVYPQHPYDDDSQLDEQSHSAPAKMYLGIHAACDELANRAIRDPFDTKLRNLNELWLVLERRCAGYLHQRQQQRPTPRNMNYVPPIPDRSPGKPLSLGFERYYVPRHCIDAWGDEWEGWWDENPIEIPDLTSSLLSCLERLDDGQVEITREASPEEIRHYTYSFFQDMNFFDKPDEEISQSMWKEIFFQIPFLWDLNVEAVYNKTGSSTRDIVKWNWEKLTRQVMSSPTPTPLDADSYNTEGIWSYDNVGLNIAGGFTNRRRIWQILQDMRLDDMKAQGLSSKNSP